MKVLVIGGGGREHALAWKIAQSPRVQCVYVAPGNGGTAHDKRLVNLAINDPAQLAAWAFEQKIELTVVGPEQPLSAGVVDLFRAQGLRIVGPTQAAAQLESSKAFSKNFMARHGIPSARYATFEATSLAHAYIDQHGAPIVVKADGLAAGKGVVVAMTAQQAHDAVDAMLVKNGDRLVIEEFLEGEEASFIVLCDGTHVLPLASSQDHKRLGTGDTGPNTGGMGAYSPAPVVTPEVHARALREVIVPTIKGMASEGIPFTGFLYAGLMIDTQGKIKTLEFNVRLGDPETQAILPRMKSDFVPALLAAAQGQLGDIELLWDRRTCLSVVVAAQGYPNQPRTGDVIAGLPKSAEAQNDLSELMVFHAATKINEAGLLVSSGGRVLAVSAMAQTVKAAQSHAYHVVNAIELDGAQWRTDIGHKALIG